MAEMTPLCPWGNREFKHQRGYNGGRDEVSLHTRAEMTSLPDSFNGQGPFISLTRVGND